MLGPHAEPIERKFRWPVEARGAELFAKDPQVHKLELLAAKVPGVGKAKTA
jgi:hypothetical protein